MKLKESENIYVLGAFLGAIALISALVLGLISQLTAPAIQQAAAANEKKALLSLGLPKFDNVPAQDCVEVVSPGGFKVTFMRARQGQQVVGFAAKATNNGGYAGAVELLCGLTTDGKFTAVVVTKQSETPGLGADVCQRKFRKTIAHLGAKAEGLPPNRILDQFTGRRAAKAKWQVKKDGGEFEFKTGATITSRVVTTTVSEIGAAFIDNQAKLMKRGAK